MLMSPNNVSLVDILANQEAKAVSDANTMISLKRNVEAYKQEQNRTALLAQAQQKLAAMASPVTDTSYDNITKNSLRRQQQQQMVSLQNEIQQNRLLKESFRSDPTMYDYYQKEESRLSREFTQTQTQQRQDAKQYQRDLGGAYGSVVDAISSAPDNSSKQLAYQQGIARMAEDYPEEATAFAKKYGPVLSNQALMDLNSRAEQGMTRAEELTRRQAIADASSRKQAHEENLEERRLNRIDRERAAQERKDMRDKAAEEKTQKVTAETYRQQRAVNALGGIASGLETLVEFSSDTTTGILPSLVTKDGMINAVRNMAGRSMSTPEQKMMYSFQTGLGRDLAQAEAGGVATGLSNLAHTMETGTYITAGDDPFTIALRLADIRRIAVEHMRPNIEAGIMTGKQAETAQKLIDKIEQLIPYTTTDVVKAARKSSRTKTPTTGEKSRELIGVPKTAEEFLNKIGAQ